jgi:DNA invertase Pin-like site-specific DNA recombinase
MKAFGYIRVSGKGQLKGDGLRRQEEAVRQYAQEHGMTLANVYSEEGVSGTLGEADRPAFQDMITDMLKNGVRTVIIEGVDRLARALMVQEQLITYLASKGITLVSARTGEDVTAAIMGDPMKKTMVQMQGVFSELEKSLLVKKLRVARESKRALEGKCEGRRGMSETEDGRAIIAMVRKLRRKPRNGRRKSYASIAAQLNEQGDKTMAGKPWTAANVQNVLRRS